MSEFSPGGTSAAALKGRVAYAEWYLLHEPTLPTEKLSSKGLFDDLATPRQVALKCKESVRKYCHVLFDTIELNKGKPHSQTKK